MVLGHPVFKRHAVQPLGNKTLRIAFAGAGAIEARKLIKYVGKRLRSIVPNHYRFRPHYQDAPEILFSSS